jgi:hypothetical protein
VRLTARLARSPSDAAADAALQGLAVRLYGLSREAVDAVVSDFPRLPEPTARRMREAAGE